MSSAVELRRAKFRENLELAIQKLSGKAVGLARELKTSEATIGKWRKNGLDKPSGHSVAVLRRLVQLLELRNIEELFEQSATLTNVRVAETVVKINSNGSVVRDAVLSRFKEIVSSSTGNYFLAELLESEEIGPVLIRKILYFQPETEPKAEPRTEDTESEE